MNIIQKYQYDQFVKRDLWREARAKARPGLLVRLLLWVQGLLRGRPAAGILGLTRDANALIIDLSSYNPNANVESLIDQGVTHFFLRLLYIDQYVYEKWQLVEDPTYRRFYDRIRAHAAKTGKRVKIGGYILYTAGVEDADYARSTIYTDRVGEIMGSAYRPDVLILDDEVNTWWQNGKKVTATQVNQVKGLVELRRKLYARFHILVAHYSARWFLNQYKDEYTTNLDNLNRPESLGGVGLQFPFWTAWYPQTFSEVFTLVRNVLSQLLTPTATQELNYLNAPGSYTGWEAWQFTSSLMTPYNTNALGQPAGLDASVSRQSVAAFNAALGITDTTPPPPPPPDDGGTGTPPDAGDLAELIQRMSAYEQAFIKLKTRVDAAAAGLAEK